MNELLNDLGELIRDFPGWPFYVMWDFSFGITVAVY